MSSKHSWGAYLWTADEFLIAYASSSANSSTSALFMVGHAVELYLKAANAKMTGNIDLAVKFGHQIKDLWDDCKAKDANFMPNYELRDSVFSKPFLEEDIDTIFSREDALHYIKNQEFYIVAKHLMDVKYFGGPLKTIKRPYSYAIVSQNPYWIAFLKELRGYLKHPTQGANDCIGEAINGEFTSLQAKSYLLSLYFNPNI